LNFSIVDVVFIGLIGLFMIRCYVKGFISELLSMAAVLLGFFAALYFYRTGGEYIREQFMPDIKTLPEVLAFISLFIIVFLVLKIIESMLKGIIERVSLGGADRFLGIIFGMAEGVAVVCLILFLLQIQPLFDPSQILSESFFASLLMPLIGGASAEGVPGV
jgi:membrane protein required for colicin V production